MTQERTVNLVTIGIQLKLLKNFLNCVSVEADRELSSIEERRLAGEFQSLGDLEQAVDYPIARIEIAARAIAYELVALVEGELHRLAHGPWLNSTVHKGPKNIQELLDVNPETLTKLGMVSDLPFDEIVKLIETSIGLNLCNVEGWNEIRVLRNAVNSLKHRRGLKHPREIDWRSKDCVVPQRYRISREETAEMINTVDRFFSALKGVLGIPLKQLEPNLIEQEKSSS
ncbi:MAG TPA: hypothetical protein VLA99_02180 [Nitrospiraceae bacterium]|nr:hypothetical protein [Nitrospiraceae bacterium]